MLVNGIRQEKIVNWDSQTLKHIFWGRTSVKKSKSEMKRLLSFLDALSFRTVANIQMTSSWKLKILDQEERSRVGAKYLSSINGSWREEQKDSYPLKRTWDGALDRASSLASGKRKEAPKGSRKETVSDERRKLRETGWPSSRWLKGLQEGQRNRSVIKKADRAALRKMHMTTISWAKLLLLSETHIWHSYFFNKKLSLAVLKLLCHL